MRNNETLEQHEKRLAEAKALHAAEANPFRKAMRGVHSERKLKALRAKSRAYNS